MPAYVTQNNLILLARTPSLQAANGYISLDGPYLIVPSPVHPHPLPLEMVFIPPSSHLISSHLIDNAVLTRTARACSRWSMQEPLDSSIKQMRMRIWLFTMSVLDKGHCCRRKNERLVVPLVFPPLPRFTSRATVWHLSQNCKHPTYRSRRPISRPMGTDGSRSRTDDHFFSLLFSLLFSLPLPPTPFLLFLRLHSHLPTDCPPILPSALTPRHPHLIPYA